MQKSVRPTRVGVTAAGIVEGTLLLGVVGTTSGMLWAIHAQGIAEDARRIADTARAEEAKRAEELDQVAKFQQERLGDVDAARMGLALGEALGERGCHVAFTYRDSRHSADAAVNAVRARGVRGLAIAADLVDRAAAARTVGTVVAEFGALDILIRMASR